MEATLFTPSGVRMRKFISRAGELNWLLFPGGPGIGSESLEDLAAAITVSGTIWLVDLPRDGSNQSPPAMVAEPFSDWPQVLVEAVDAVPNPVVVGHSTGGMYLLATPALEARICGMALVDTAPDSAWHPYFKRMTEANPLPAFDAAVDAFARSQRPEDLTALVVASAEWNFEPDALESGRALLRKMPYSNPSILWSDQNFDHVYEAAWWPTSVPVLIVAGARDRIVWQGGWDNPPFQTPNRIQRSIPGAGHFPWIENPQGVSAAFAELDESIRRVRTAI
jgi:pimeloyl-ACP methyl ester carboxylesterase